LQLPVDARHIQYRHIVSIRIETLEGTLLAEYTPEVILRIRNITKTSNKNIESWIFTEKGLYLITEEIAERCKRDWDKIIEYYRSDEAAQELQLMLDTQ
jgi:hypothetical protein